MRWERFRHFIRRNNLTIGFTVISIALGAILLLQAAATNKIQTQQETEQQILNQVKTAIDKIDAAGVQRTNQIDQLNRHLDCIVLFFTDPNRAQKSIEDIDTCTLKNNNTGQTSNPLGPSGVLTPSTPQQSPTSGNNSGQQSNSGSSNGNQSSGGNDQPGFLERNIIQPIKNLINRL